MEEWDWIHGLSWPLNVLTLLFLLCGAIIVRPLVPGKVAYCLIIGTSLWLILYAAHSLILAAGMRNLISPGLVQHFFKITGYFGNAGLILVGGGLLVLAIHLWRNWKHYGQAASTEA